MIDDESPPGSWAEALHFRRHMYTGEDAMRLSPIQLYFCDPVSDEHRHEPADYEVDAYDRLLLPVDEDTAIGILRAYLKQHLRYLEADINDEGLHSDDKEECSADIAAMKRVLEYIGN